MLKKILFLLLILLTFGKIPAFSDKGSESVTFTDNSESVAITTDNVTFKDPVIQKFVDKNRTLLKELIIAAEANDIKKLQKLNFESEKMRIKIPEMKKRVAKDPVENQKFYDEIRKMFKEFDEEMLRLAERHVKKSDN